MYNKLFTKILDSSIWLESTTTRLVWLTFLAAMDEHGFAQFASASNVAHRARVTVEEAEGALKVLEAPDKDSADKDNEGRRLEKVPGGWMVLNSMKYRDLVTKAVIQEQTRLRVKRYRDHKNGIVEPDNPQCNAPVTHSNESVTPSEAISDIYKESSQVLIRYLNEKAGTQFRDSASGNIKFISARLKDGASLEDCKLVIDSKVKEWRGTDYAQYLRPETLFKPSKFESYLGVAKAQPVKAAYVPQTTEHLREAQRLAAIERAKKEVGVSHE